MSDFFTDNAADLAAVQAALRVGSHSSVGALGCAMSDTTTSFAIQTISDSTGDEPGEWPYQLALDQAAVFPTKRVEFSQWDDATQAYGVVEVVQAGSAGERGVSFTAGSYGRYIPAADVLPLPGIIDVSVKVNCTAKAAGSAQHIVGRWGTANHCFYFGMSATGAPQYAYSLDGTTDVLYTSGTPWAWVDGTDIWLRAVHDTTTGIVVFYRSTDGVTWVTHSTSSAQATGAIYNSPTQVWEIGARGGLDVQSGNTSPFRGTIYKVCIRTGVLGPIQNPEGIEAWARNSSDTATTSLVGSPTIHVLNGAKAGEGLAYFTDAVRLPKIIRRFNGAYTVLSTSHNDGARKGPTLITVWEAWVAAIFARAPTSQICVLKQNPKLAGVADRVEEHAQRVNQLQVWAGRKGFDCIETFRPFLVDPRGLAALLKPDGVHPSVGEGQPLQAAVVNDFFRRRAVSF
ncbi:MAG: SGNH/GDSL hydrolase family protein [Brevundimonas sp.]